MSDVKDKFTEIFDTNFWDNKESVSGPGSTLQQTLAIRMAIPKLFRRLGIRSVLDIPCGDFHWWPFMDLPNSIWYIGADVVESLVDANRESYPELEWQVLDVTTDDLPGVNLVFVRDCLGHLPYYLARDAIRNIKRSGAKFLVATTFFKHEHQDDIPIGGWHPVNLEEPYFELGQPIELINEGIEATGFSDKCLGVWRIDQ